MACLMDVLRLVILCTVLGQAYSECPELDHPDNGIVSIQITNGVPRASYTCRIGFYISGNNYRDCENNSTWTGTKPTCEVVVCPTPEPFENGNITLLGSGSYQYGDTIVYECFTGYRLTGQASLTCEWDGLWSDTAPTCEILSCDSLPSVENGDVNSNGTVYNSFATYTCDSGYVVTGSSSTSTIVRCTENGWELSSVTCSIDTEYCPAMADFPSISRVIDAVVNLSCSQVGFVVDGATTLTCQTNGTWSDTIPTCEIFNCGDLSNVSDGFFNLTSGTTYGSVASYFCNLGYTLSTDSNQRNCTLAGWSGVNIQCDKYACASRSNPTSGEVVLTDRNFYGSKAEYSCNTGYELIGEANYECTMNGWTPSDTSPSCRIYNCGDLSNPQNGRVDMSNGTEYGAIAEYSCLTGYEASTSTQIECLASGQWNVTNFTCNIVECPVLPSIPNAVIDVTSNTYGAVATFSCNIGFVGVGTNTTTCEVDGQWTSYNFTCEVYECSRLSRPVGLLMDMSNGTSYNSVVTYNCEIGYTLNGSNNKVCTMLDWQPSETPYCEIKDCGDLQNPNNGSVDTSNGTKYGAIANYSCFTGHTASTSTQNECLESGQWSISSFSCIPVVCSGILVDPPDGTIDVTSNTFGGQAQYRCTTVGYVGSGTSISTCQATGLWSAVDFQCVRHRCTPGLTDPDNGGIDYTDSDYYSSNATYRCDAGYQVMNATTHNCTLSGWEPSEQNTYCQIYDCGILQNPDNGRVDLSNGTKYGAIAEYSCFTGYEASTSTRNECLESGQWSISNFTCNIVECPELPSIPNAVIDVTSNTYGAVATFSCNLGFVGVGTNTTTCEADGQWTSYNFTCEVYECSRLSRPVDLLMDMSNGTSYNSVVTYNCEIGFTLNGSNNKVCTMSDWQPSETPYCEIKDCGDLQNPNNGSVDTSNGTKYGAIANYSCFAGYEASTSTQNECLESGQWSITSFTCNPVDCGNVLQYPTEGTIDVTSSTFGGQAQYRCTTVGYVGSGTSISTCQATGLWSAVDFQCVRHRCTPGLTDPDNGGIDYTDSDFYSSNATYRCDAGYQVMNATTHNCTLSGWEPSEQNTYCQIYDCGILQNPNNGRVDLSNGTKYGAIAEYSCFTGYEASTSTRNECLESGQWSISNFTCNIVECPELPSIPNAVIDVTSNTYGAVATFSCNLGFVGVGINTTTCEADGQWTSYNFTCEVYECSRLSRPVDLLMDMSNGTSYNSVVTYNCEIGYTLNGSNNKVCTMSDWQPPETPYCEIKDCGDLQNPDNGSVDTSNGTKYGAIANYSCFAGYEASTSTQNECLESGQWSITSFTCNPVDCGNVLQYPTEGTIDVTSSTFGGQAQYRCTTVGYVGSGTSISTCQATGLWSAVDFQCVRHRCTPGLTGPDNGGIDYTDSDFYSSQATYRCDAGYKVMNATTHDCTLSGWEPSEQNTYCQIYDCGIPPSPNNCTVSYSNGTKYDAVAEYECEAGYYTNDPTRRTCLDGGQWSGSLPTCSPVDCLTPPSVPFSTLIFSGGTTYTQTVRYECLEGYVFTGIDLTVCQSNGSWSSGSRSCDRYECLPQRTNPTNGYISSQSDGNFYGSKVEYDCFQGYQLIGNKTQNCTMTGWVPAQSPICQILDCGRPPSISFGTLDYTRGTEYGATAIYGCLTGYTVSSGSVELLCSAAGSWSGSPLECEPVDCGQPTFLQYGNIVSIGSTTYGSTVTYECSTEGYVLDGSNNTTCLASGNWSNESRACNLHNCGQLNDPTNGSVDLTEGTFYGAIATYSCNYGYERIGNQDQNCTMLGWYPDQSPVCQIYDCNQPPEPLNGFVSYNETTFGAVALYTCATGYFITAGNTERTCDHHGVWTGVEVECSIVQCGTPPLPDNGYATRTDITSFEGTVGYECNEGYILEGNNYTTCEADGQWRPEQPVCKRHECSSLQNQANGEVTLSDFNFYDSIATYKCATGYQLVGNVTRNCTLDDWFPPETPNCQVVDCGDPPSGDDIEVSYNGTTTYGSVVRYNCETGYTGILANTQITCESTGQWSFAVLQCSLVDCGNPVVANTSANSNLMSVVLGTTYGAVAEFSCMTGYQLEGEARLTCLASGQWSANAPSCKLVDCGGLPLTILNGDIEQTGTTYGQTATSNCYLGYELSINETSRTITCGAAGNWEGKVEDCHPVDCGNLTAPVNGQINVPSTTYLEIAAYTCNRGHNLVGRNHRQCQANATWNREAPYCEPFDCGELTAPAFGNVSTPDGTTYGKMAIYTCELGYNATAGNLMRSCANGSRWDGSPPVCTVHNCGPVPSEIRNGTVSSTGTTYRSTATFVCDSGYIMTEGVTQVTLTCNAEGRWNDDIPSCIPIDCGSLASPNHGYVNYSGSLFNGVARYSCALGYRLIGNEQRVCQTDGRWSADEPTCQLIVCSNLTNPEHGFVNILDGYLLGHVAIYSCQRGYKLEGNVNRTCLTDGQWSGLPPTCQIHDCGPLPLSIANGTVVTTGNEYGDDFIYMCEANYYVYMRGQAYSTYIVNCTETGQWSDVPPTCNYIDCGQLPAPANGKVEMPSGSVYRSQALYVCEDGYRLVGNEISVCLANGNWNGTMPFCQILDCGPLPSLLYGEMMYDSTTYGQTVTYTCSIGYRLVNGSNTRTCTASGRWNGTQPVCELLDCGELEPPAHSTVYTPTGTRYGSMARYSCDRGYYRSGGSIFTTCTNNGWDSPPIQCTIYDCLTPPVPVNGDVSYQDGTTYGTVATYNCNFGYYISAGSEEIHCGEGDWNGTTPTCTPYDCTTLPSPTNGLVTVSMTFYGERADYRCNDGYYLSGGDETRMCLNNSNTWNGTEPTCTIHRCGSISLDLDNGDAEATGILYQDTAVYTCYRGYLIAGRDSRTFTVTCTGIGNWSDVPPVCVPVNCGQPADIVHGRVMVSSTGFGALAQYFCDDGYQLNGTSSILCQANGVWSSRVPECLVYDCGELPDIEHGNVTVDRTTYQGRALYTCDTGYFISSGTEALVCQDGGIWSGSQPVCTKYDCAQLSTSLKNGDAIQTGTKYGDTTVFMCEAGYHIEGLTVSMVTVECTETGDWSRTKPTCDPIDCGPLTNPAHGDVRLEAGTGYLDVARYVCGTGYKLVGRSTVICLDSGEWSHERPECHIHDCGPLENPTWGTVELTMNSTVYGSTATYSCLQGYYISGGSEERRCTGDGTWDGTQPTCSDVTLIDCGSHAGPLNGFVVFPAGTTYGKTAVYNCDTGYELTGSAPRVCGTSGQWEGDMPNCTLQGCGDLMNPGNGSVFISVDNNDLQTAVYRCDTGYLLVGDEMRTCDGQGTWTGFKPSCVRTDCGKPDSPSNGDVTYSGSTVGSTALYTCEIGYRMNGTANRLCLSSGEWSGTTPSCVQRTCPSIQAFSNGSVEVSAGSSYGSVAMFYCDTMYELVGPTSIVCLADGSWSASPPSCLIRGTIEAVPVNLKLNLTLPSNVDFQNQTTRQIYEQELREALLSVFRSYMGGDMADIVIVNLQTGSLIVEFTVMMQSGPDVKREFSEALQTIADHTQPISVFNTVSYSTQMQVKNIDVPVGASSQSMQEMLCTVRQVMDGACQSGYICEVTNFEPTCQPDPNTDCGLPQSPTDGSFETPEGTKYGAPVIYSCATGYTLEGQGRGTCEASGRWEPSRPMCSVTDCGGLVDPVNGDVVVMGTQYLNTAQYTCNPGYSLLGTAMVNCQADGHWSADPPTCTLILCGSLAHPTHGNVTLSLDGQSAIYMCKPGHRLVGNQLSTCLPSGQWEGTPPTCEIISCQTLINPANGVVDVSSGLSYGHTAIYSCIGVEYELVGPSVRTCTEDGSWSGTTPTCNLRDCGFLSMFRNGNMDVSGTKYGDTAIFGCNSGYILHGESLLTCRETGWDNPQPTCLHVGDCGGVTNIANGGVIVNNGTNIGARVTYECNTGYRLVGDTSRVCLGDSTWSGAQPYCSIQACPVLMPPSGGRLQLSGDGVYGETAYIICDPGYKVEGPSSITCQADGTWSGTLSCTIKDCGALTNPENGMVDLVMGTSFGAQAQYICNPGHTLTGTSVRTCGTTEQWSLAPPTCVAKDCGSLMDPTSGTVTLDGSSTYGHIATYRCNLGYSPTGPTQRQCGADGVWTEAAPECIRKECGVIVVPANGQVTVTQGSYFGSVVSYTCNQGYHLDGQHVNRTCMGNLQWSGVAPTCVKVDCGPIRDPLFGRLSLSSGTTFNSRATYACSTGYTLEVGSSAERICMHNGTWSGTMPSCVVVDCGNPRSLSNGIVSAPEGTVYGRVATYSCDTNYDLSGPKTRTCQADGFWSETAPKCEMGNNFKLALGLGIGLSGFFILILVIILVAVICYRRNNYRQRKRTDRKYGSRSRILEYTTPIPTVSHSYPVKMRQPKPVIMPVGPQIVVDDGTSVYTEQNPRYKTYVYDNLPRDDYINYSYFRPSV